jgi:hypothetical protein
LDQSLPIPNPDQDDSAYPEIPLPPPPKPGSRKRGGQPNNRNALKHGFYARSFDRAIVNDLDIRAPHIDDEILLLRVYMRRIVDNSLKSGSLDDLQTLRVLALASSIIGRLFKISKAFEPTQQDVLTNAMNEAIEMLRAERGWK